MKIGVTSQNFRTVTGHAGKTRRFFIYDTNKDRSFQEPERLDLPKEMSMHAYKSTAPHPVEAFDVLITASCGEGFQRKMAARNIELIITDETDPLTAVMTRLNAKNSQQDDNIDVGL